MDKRVGDEKKEMAIVISDYQIIEELYESQNSLVYRAKTLTHKQPVILKMLIQAYPPPETIAWFKREYDTIKRLNVSGVVDAYDFINIQGRWIIILEDFGGESMEKLITPKPLSLNRFLPVAITLVDILGKVHQKQIIHKDINPSNIVWNPETGQIKLIDFGLSTTLEREKKALCSPYCLEGTLSYIAPEQTGRMNRGIDYRTDFYSLGVTFYKLLTGQLPFKSSDVMELIHAHIAKQPLPPCQLNPKIPMVLSDLVMKLMAKNAEDRYQSTYGLKTDLERCSQQLSSGNQQFSFALGQQDIREHFQDALQITRSSWLNINPSELIELPPMTNPEQLAAIKILFELLHPTYEASPLFFVLVALSMVDLSLEYGNTALSAPGYATYGGMILCGIEPLDIDAGYQFGQVALDLVERQNAKELKAVVLSFVYCFSRPWKDPLKETLPPLAASYQFGLETGDLQYGGLGAYIYSFHLYWMGKNLKYVESEMAKYSKALHQNHQEHFLSYQNRYWQVVLNLRGKTKDVCCLTGAAYEEEVMLPTILAVNDRYALGDFYLHKFILCYLFQDFQGALNYAATAEQYLDSMLATVAVAAFYFYDSLVQLAIFPHVDRAQQQKISQKVIANQEKMKLWAEHAPSNFLHKFKLVEAEQCAVLGKISQGREYYDEAIMLASDHEFLNEQALASELAGKFYLLQGKNHVARHYLQDAHYLYQQWGACLNRVLPLNFPPLLKWLT